MRGKRIKKLNGAMSSGSSAGVEAPVWQLRIAALLSVTMVLGEPLSREKACTLFASDETFDRHLHEDRVCLAAESGKGIGVNKLQTEQMVSIWGVQEAS
jgi:hypothetical protein